MSPNIDNNVVWTKVINELSVFLHSINSLHSSVNTNENNNNDTRITLRNNLDARQPQFGHDTWSFSVALDLPFRATQTMTITSRETTSSARAHTREAFLRLYIHGCSSLHNAEPRHLHHHYHRSKSRSKRSIPADVNINPVSSHTILTRPHHRKNEWNNCNIFKRWTLN